MEIATSFEVVKDSWLFYSHAYGEGAWGLEIQS